MAVSRPSGNYATAERDVISRESARMFWNFLPDGIILLAAVSPFVLNLLYQGYIILYESSQKLSLQDATLLVILQEAQGISARDGFHQLREFLQRLNTSLRVMAIEINLKILVARNVMLEN